MVKMLRFFFLCVVLLFSTHVSDHRHTVFAEKQTLFVKHHVKGNNVFVECIVDQFTFTKGKHPKKKTDKGAFMYMSMGKK